MILNFKKSPDHRDNFKSMFEKKGGNVNSPLSIEYLDDIPFIAWKGEIL